MSLSHQLLTINKKESSGNLHSAIASISHNKFRLVAKELSNAIAELHATPPVIGSKKELPDDLPDALITALTTLGITKLYSHQIEALEVLRAGMDLSIVTPTASGKTLCFNPAIIETCLRDRTVSALYIFPLKALALDQFGKLQSLIDALPQEERIKVGMITGDVPLAERLKLFSATYPRILIVSPDLLHFQLYKTRSADWQHWREFLANLKYVVIDEAHTYIGSFGINFANLLRRLTVTIDRLGGNADKLQYIFSSATVGNPTEMALRFSNREKTPDRLHLIERSGAASAGNTVLCLKLSKQPNLDCAHIVISWLQKELSGIVFCNSRGAVKSLLWRIQKELEKENAPHLARKLAAFYGSILGEKRREIIDKVKSGKASVIISTSALEAGIDLPELDCCLIYGYPGSLMSFRQRVGRAGRGNPGLIIFLPSAMTVLDNYYGDNPKHLLHGKVESAAFNPDYPTVMSRHIECCCAEAGIPKDKLTRYFGDSSIAVANILLDQKKIALNNGLLTAKGFPHKEVNIRGHQLSSVALIDKDTRQTLEEMSADIAIREVYPAAVYSLQKGDDAEVNYYICESLDLEHNNAVLKRYPNNPGVQTMAIVEQAIEILSVLTDQETIATSFKDAALNIDLLWGKIREEVTGYHILKKRYGRICNNKDCEHYKRECAGFNCPVCGKEITVGQINEYLGRKYFDKPYQVSHSAPVLRIEANKQLQDVLNNRGKEICSALIEKYGENIPSVYQHYIDYPAAFLALHSLEHLLILALPMLILSSVNDLNGFVVSDLPNNTLTCYFYDTADGGNGAAESVYERFGEIAAKARLLAKSCECQRGCPRCMVKNRCGEDNQGLDKKLCLWLLDAIVENNR